MLVYFYCWSQTAPEPVSSTPLASTASRSPEASQSPDAGVQETKQEADDMHWGASLDESIHDETGVELVSLVHAQAAPAPITAAVTAPAPVERQPSRIPTAPAAQASPAPPVNAAGIECDEFCCC